MYHIPNILCCHFEPEFRNEGENIRRKGAAYCGCVFRADVFAVDEFFGHLIAEKE